MPGHRNMEEIDLDAMLVAERLVGVAPDVILMYITHMPPPRRNEAAHSGFKTHSRHHQKS